MNSISHAAASGAIWSLWLESLFQIQSHLEADKYDYL